MNHRASKDQRTIASTRPLTNFETLREARETWERDERNAAVQRVPERQKNPTTLSGIQVPELASPLESNPDYLESLGFPGKYPFTRGVQPTGYRNRSWTMRLFAGFGSPLHTNARFRYLLAQGQTGLSTAYDFPTLMGYDSDSERAKGEVGVCGVAVDTVADVDLLYKDIPLDQVTTSMTINGPAIVLLAFYVALADMRGIERAKLGGTIQNDCLKEFIAQHAWLVPPRPAMRLVTDMMEFCTAELPRWNTISISGYHMREAGATAIQELAFTLANGIAYVNAGIERGLDVNQFAQRLSFFWDVHNDFFEEIAKFRAGRRMWARIMKERFGATNERAMMLRAHAQTAGVSLTAQQPYNNVVRIALQALAAVLGGTQSLHTNSLDETYALPTEEAATLALRTQQIIALETGVTHTVDPLAGSYYLEWLTDRIEAEALSILEAVDGMGGMVEAVENGYPQREIAKSAYKLQREIESGERRIVGVNCYTQSEEPPIPTLKIDEAVEREQRERLAQVKASRDAAAVQMSLARVRHAAESGQNLMPPLVEAAKAYCTEQELCDVLREVLGTHTERTDGP